MNLITLKCDNCLISFERKLSEHQGNLRRGRKFIFCSKACFVSFAAAKSSTASCDYCGKDFSRPKHSRDSMKYCSKRCYGQSRKIYGPPAPKLTKQAKSRQRYSRKLISLIYPKTLQELKNEHHPAAYHAKVRGSSRSVYQHFEGIMVCAVCQYSLHVDICHIKPVSQFPLSATLAEVNAFDNLIALCKNHHWEFDNGYISLEDIAESKNG